MKILYLLLVTIISSNICVSQEIKREGELNGVVEIGKGKRKKILDYNFNVIYSNDSCANNIGNLIKDFTEDVDSLDFVAPKIADNLKNWYEFLGTEIHYPLYAIENGIKGKIYIHFEISSTGEVRNIWIRKGVHISVDKETVRTIRKLKFATPPLLNGKPIDLCVDIPILYEL